MTATLASLDFKVGRVNPSGISPIAYFIAKEDIASWPVKKDDIADAASLDKFANLDGDFVLVTGKKWLKVYCTQGKGKCTFEPFGETDSKMYNNKAELFFPDLDDNARAFATVAANGDFVFIIPTPGAVAKYHVIGDKYWRATVETNGVECPIAAYYGVLEKDGDLRLLVPGFPFSGETPTPEKIRRERRQTDRCLKLVSGDGRFRFLGFLASSLAAPDGTKPALVPNFNLLLPADSVDPVTTNVPAASDSHAENAESAETDLYAEDAE